MYIRRTQDNLVYKVCFCKREGEELPPHLPILRGIDNSCIVSEMRISR